MTLPSPALGTRGTAGYRYAELFLALGPQAIGVTNESTLDDLIGRVWALVLTRERRLELYQRAVDAATWELQTALLPPLFAQTQPESRRRFSIAFDQSARANVAYEENGTIYLTRWDATVGAYVQNVTIAGVDPVVAFDATWAYDVTVSDVLLFYLPTDRTRLLVRVQRDIYADEVELHDYGAPVVLDRVTRLPLRYQALASDGLGDPLEVEGERVGLLSDLYPYPAFDDLAVAVDGPASGDYILTVIFTEHEDAGVAGTAVGPAAGVYQTPVISYEAVDLGVDASGVGPVSGIYRLPIISYEDAEGVDASGVGPASGDYVLVVLSYVHGFEGVDVTATGPTGGSYDPA